MIAPRLLALNCIRSLQEFSRHYDASSSSSSSLPFLSSKHPSLFHLLPPRELAILQRVPSSSWADLETIEMILHAILVTKLVVFGRNSRIIFLFSLFFFFIQP